LRDNGRAWAALWVVVILITAFGLSLYYGLHPLWDDEAMYAEVPREMLAGGGLLYPTLNYAPFLFKPPLFIWANALSMHILGDGALAYRLPTALFAGLTALFAYGIGARTSRTAGIYAGFACATLYGIVFHNAEMLTDMPLMFFTTASMYFFLNTADGRRYGAVLVYACLALAVMTKGLIGLVFPGIAFAAFIVSAGRYDILKKLASLPGALMFICITVPWHVLMELKHPGFLYSFVVNEQVMRFFNKRFPPDYDSVSTPWFILVTLGWTMPWLAFLFQSLARAWRRRADDTLRLALCWALGGMVFLGLASSKMEYYSLPLLPAFSALIGLWWAGLGEEGGKGVRGAVVGAASLGVFSLLVILAGPYMFGRLGGLLEFAGTDAAGLSGMALKTFLPLTAGSVGAAALFYYRRHTWAFALFTLSALAMLVQARAAVALVTPAYSDEDAAIYAASVMAPSDTLVVDGDREYEFSATFNFYAHKKLYILSNGGQPVLPVKFSEADRFVMTDPEFRALWGSGARVYLSTTRRPDMGGVAGVPGESFRQVFKGSKTVYVNVR